MGGDEVQTLSQSSSNTIQWGGARVPRYFQVGVEVQDVRAPLTPWGVRYLLPFGEDEGLSSLLGLPWHQNFLCDIWLEQSSYYLQVSVLLPFSGSWLEKGDVYLVFIFFNVCAHLYFSVTGFFSSQSGYMKEKENPENLF